MIYVMSDIHGCYDRYRSILKQIRLQKDDHLYILGDVLDRGPDGLRILRDTMKSENITLLLGNHEYMMLEALTNPDDADAQWLWYRNGGKVTHEHFKRCTHAYRAEVLGYMLEKQAEESAQETEPAPSASEDESSAASDTVATAMAMLVIENTHLREVIRHLRDTIAGLTDHKLL